MTKPTLRIAVDWDNDLFICYDSVPTDALNRLHSGLSDSDPNYVNLHWGYVNKSGINSAVVSFEQEFTAYGIRKLRTITGTNVTAGAYFGRTGSTNDFTVVNGQTYTAVFWIKASVGSGVGMTFLMENSAGSQAFTISGSWQKITRTFTATGVTTSFKITKTNSATDVTFDVAGLMLVDGSDAPNGFNVGNATNRYDIITADVRSADWRIGKDNWANLMPSEGVATLLVNNGDRKYTPEYSLSPLYGYMQQKRLVTIDVQKPSDSTWVRKFAGWTRQYLPSYGRTRDKTSTITCEQGVFRLREIRYRKPVDGTTTADVVIQSVLFDGYVFANTPLQCLVDFSHLNAGYLIDPAAVMTLDTGVSEIDLSGEAWGEKDSAANVIEELLTVERGWFFILGDGRIRFFNRHHYIDPATAPVSTAFNLDNEVLEGDYRHSENFYNVVQLTHYPFTLAEGEVLWTLRENVALRRRRMKEIEVRFEREEGTRFEVESVNPFGSGNDDSTYTAVNIAGDDRTDDVFADFSLTDGRSGILTLKNTSASTRRVNFLQLKGTVRESYGGQMVEVVSEDGTQGGSYIKQENTKLISTDTEAGNLAHYLLNLHDNAVGEFHNIQLANRSDAILEKIVENDLGDTITVSEYQTAHNGEYVIVGERFAWSPGELRSTLILDPLFRRPPVWIVGTSALNDDAYLAY